MVDVEGREKRELKERVVEINRVAKVVKGGRRFSFTALVVIGDEVDRVGVGYGKAREVPLAISKAVDDAKKNLFTVPEARHDDHPRDPRPSSTPRACSCARASEGTGVIAGGGVRAVLELAGIRDVLAKSLGTTNPINMAKATVNGLQQPAPARGRREDARQDDRRGAAVARARRGAVAEPAEAAPAPEPRRGRRPRSRSPRREHRQGDQITQRDRPEPTQPWHAAGARARAESASRPSTRRARSSQACSERSLTS